MTVHVITPEPTDGIDAAMQLAARCLRDVPAYRDFAQAAGVDEIASVDDFRRLPPMTKKNYLQCNGIDEMMWHGDATGAALWSTSSGSSGKPTYFPRDERATAYSTDVFDRIFTDHYRSRSRSTLVIVAFAMGNWIAGTYSMLGMMELRKRNHRLVVATPGMSIEAIHDMMADLGPSYDQVVLVGYPPFVKDILDTASPDILALDINLQLAGQAITEQWRDYILDKIGRPGEANRICLIYGTADAGVMGYETPASIAVRRLALADEPLRDSLFGDVTALPTFCEIDAEHRYVESQDGYLLFTIDAALPLIRYRINDRGWPFSGAQLRERLRGHGHPELAEQIDPSATFLVLTGRNDVADTFYSVNIYPENLQQVFEHPDVTPSTSGKFYVTTRFDDDQNENLDIHVELSRGTRPGSALSRRLGKLCTETLRATNSEYRELHRIKGAAAEPTINFHRFQSRRFAADRGKFIPGTNND